VRFTKPKLPASAFLTVLGFLLLSAAAAVLGAIVSVLLCAGLGLAAAGVSCLLMGWLAEDEPAGAP
jgi:hypothetical protein